MSQPRATSIETTLGPALERVGPIWILDLSTLPLLHGLSVLSRALGERVLARARDDRGDLSVEREVRERESPELLTEFRIGSIQLRAERASLAAIVSDPEGFQDRLRILLGTLQRPLYQQAMKLPEPGGAAPPGERTALVFDFPMGDAGHATRFVLDRVEPRDRPGSSQLRVRVGRVEPIVDEDGPVRHLVVEDLHRRAFIAGSTRIAETLAHGIRREAERGRRSHSEKQRVHDFTFVQLARAGLADIEQLRVHWGDDFMPRLLEDRPTLLGHLMKRVLLSLEDEQVRARLALGECIRIDAMSTHVYLDRSQLGRVLNLSLGEHRKQASLEDFLDRMPATRGIVRAQSTTPTGALADTSIFLIHHMTSEVLGLIAALRALSCRDLVTLFVAYAGDAPASYLDPLLDLPESESHCLALANVPAEDSVEGHWSLSSLYSKLDEAGPVIRELARGEPRFYAAMQKVALHAFIAQAERTRASGRKLLLIEDGGYLAPLLNRACLDGLDTRGLFEAIGAEPPESVPDGPLEGWLRDVLVGSVEHTRNGYDRLADLEAARGRLAIPAASIAISRLKTEVESREVSASILNATENVLSSLGLVLSRRRCLVLGSRGAIGRHLVRDLHARLDASSRPLWGVDRVAADDASAAARGNGDAAIEEVASIDQLPERARLEVDLVIGVTGHSLIDGRFVEAWLEGGTRDRLILVSGSTKTEEFADVSRWLEGSWSATPLRIGDHETHIDGLPIVDPVSGRTFGHGYRFVQETGGGSRSRELILVANATPANFMFYGVPTEAIDEVLAQLLSVSLGLLTRTRAPSAPSRLMAVDHQIDAWSRDLT